MLKYLGVMDLTLEDKKLENKLESLVDSGNHQWRPFQSKPEVHFGHMYLLLVTTRSHIDQGKWRSSTLSSLYFNLQVVVLRL